MFSKHKMENKDIEDTENSVITRVKRDKDKHKSVTASTSKNTKAPVNLRSSERNKTRNKKVDFKCTDSDTELHTDSEEEKFSKQEKEPKPLKRKRGGKTNLPRANNALSYEASWSEIDKQRLIIALQRYGVLEIEKLINAVPEKTEDEIRHFLRCKWKSSRTELRNHLKEVRKSKGAKSPYLGPVDNWLDVLSQHYPNYDHYKTNPIAHAVLLIWKYEKHPDPSECGGIDFKALYEHLYYVLAGYPPKHLNQPTAAYLQETLKNFAFRIKSGTWSEELKFLNKPMKINTQTTPTVKEDDVIAAFSYTKEQCFDELLKLPGFNPFSVPKEILKKKAPLMSGEKTITASDPKVSLAQIPTTSKASGSKDNEFVSMP